MANKQYSGNQPCSTDVVSVHQFLRSVGQLKYSLKTLCALQQKVACMPIEAANSLDDKQCNQMSSTLLERILNEIVSSRAQDMEQTAFCSSKEENVDSSCLISVEELEKVHGKLHSEMQEMRKFYHAALMMKKGS